jgi:hypothetical protein
MTETDARTICQNHGSTLLSYESGRTAYIRLPSDESIVISIGTTAVKVFTKRLIVGWKFPKVTASQSMAIWQQGFDKLDRIRRFGCGSMILDGLISLVSRCGSIEELRLAWPDLKNPLEAWAAEEVGRHVNKG